MKGLGSLRGGGVAVFHFVKDINGTNKTLLGEQVKGTGIRCGT